MVKSLNLDFFAAGADQRAVLDFLFSSTDVRVFELYSEPDTALREFRSTDELAAAFPIGTDRYGNGGAILLALRSPSVRSDLTIRRYALDPARCKGRTFRHTIEGAGLIHLHLGGVYERIITKSNLGHGSQARAKASGTEPRPVLSEALRLARHGHALKDSKGTPWVNKLASGGNPT